MPGRYYIQLWGCKKDYNPISSLHELSHWQGDKQKSRTELSVLGNIWPSSSCWDGRRESQEERTASSQRVEKGSNVTGSLRHLA